MGPVCDVYGLAHMGPIRTSPYGLPIMDPCGAQIAIPYGPSVGCIAHIFWDLYGQLRKGLYNLPMWVPYGYIA